MEERKNECASDKEAFLQETGNEGDIQEQGGTLCDSRSETERRVSLNDTGSEQGNSTTRAERLCRGTTLDPQLILNLTRTSGTSATLEGNFIGTSEKLEQGVTLDPQLILSLTKTTESERSLYTDSKVATDKTSIEGKTTNSETQDTLLKEGIRESLELVEINSNTSDSDLPGAYAIQGPSVGSGISRRGASQAGISTSFTVDDSSSSDHNMITSREFRRSSVTAIDVSAEIADDDKKVFQRARDQIIRESTEAVVLSRRELYMTPRCKLIGAAVSSILIGGFLYLGLKERVKSNKAGGESVCTPMDMSSNIFLQCQCRGEITTVGNTTLYKELAEALESNSDSMSSCTPSNQALWWLVSDTELANTSSEISINKLRNRYALAILYLSTGGGAWNRRENWLSNTDECNWEGVYCSASGNGGLNQIIVNRNNMRGTIPHEILFLSSLRRLDMRSNAIIGSIPQALPEKMKLLRRLDVSRNLITGRLPRFVNVALFEENIMEFLSDNMTSEDALERALDDSEELEGRNIYELIFSHNLITGTIPPEYSRLPTLREIWLDHNRLSGNIIEGVPAQIDEVVGRYYRIESYSVRNNSLVGQIPPAVGVLTNLEFLDWSYTHEYGTIPTEIGNLIQLRELHLNHAHFNGTIPTEILNLGQLEVLGLASPGFTGTLPSEICDVLIYLESGILVDCNTLGKNCPCCDC